VLRDTLAGKPFAASLEACNSGQRETVRPFFATQFDRHIPWAKFEVLLERTLQFNPP
jgi:hypothetical protein